MLLHQHSAIGIKTGSSNPPNGDQIAWSASWGELVFLISLELQEFIITIHRLITSQECPKHEIINHSTHLNNSYYIMVPYVKGSELSILVSKSDSQFVLDPPIFILSQYQACDFRFNFY